MSDYIYTTNGELYHYGVKGMRWGVKRLKTKFADKNIRNIQRQKAHNDVEYNYSKKELNISYKNKPKKQKRLQKKLNKIERIHSNDEAIFNYKIAKNEAFKNPSYRKTEKYKNDIKKGRAVIRRRAIQEGILGFTID